MIYKPVEQMDNAELRKELAWRRARMNGEQPDPPKAEGIRRAVRFAGYSKADDPQRAANVDRAWNKLEPSNTEAPPFEANCARDPRYWINPETGWTEKKQ